MAEKPYDDPTRPLFGESHPHDRIRNLVLGFVTGILVAATLISSVTFPNWHPYAIHIIFAVVILLIGLSHVVLIFWYRQGDLEPKFLRLIFYNIFTMILLCICCSLYIYVSKMDRS